MIYCFSDVFRDKCQHISYDNQSFAYNMLIIPTLVGTGNYSQRIRDNQSVIRYRNNK